jgi:type IX secretion system PorP/SprF family membrane protein
MINLKPLLKNEIFKKLTCMRIKPIVAALFCCCCLYRAEAQQVFAISQYIQHNFLYNPAAAGASDNPSVGALYRKMWSGIDGGPQTTILYGDTYFAKKKTGLGVFLYDDKTGPTERIGGQVNLSYSVELGSQQKRLMFGLGGMFLQYKIDKLSIIDDPYFDQGDANFLSASDSRMVGDGAAGIYLKTPTLNVGVSIEQILKTKLGFIKEASDINPEGKLYRHYFIMADYNIQTDDEDVLIPNVLVKYLYNSPVDVQGGFKLMHQDFLWVGFNYHYLQSYSFYAGVKVAHKLEIGYAYDQYSTPLDNFDDGGSANELSLRYYFLK